MNFTRGRPCKVQKSDFINTILVHKDRIALLGNKIVSKHDAVWSEISSILGGSITPISLYTMVSGNKHGIRRLIEGSEREVVNPDINISGTDDTNISGNASSVATDSSNPESINFTITISQEEFEELIVFKSYKRMQRGKIRNRIWKTFRPGVWEEFITCKIWDAIQLKCGFKFRNHYLSNIGTSGYINGNCKCGSSLRVDIESDYNTDEVLFNCKIIKGTGKCKKRYLRQPSRSIIAKQLRNKPIEVYRAEKANQLMAPGDPEPPHLPNASVLHVAKNEYIKSKFYNNNPIKALCIMKYSSYYNCIHSIAIDPFYVHYWTNHQLQLYKKYCTTNIISIYIDATGSVVKKLTKIDNSQSKHIFLYQAVINYNENQFSITQMLSERHTTNNIHFWLLEWCRTGAPCPREVVVDASKALLNAVIRCFTSYKTITDYANACKNKILPKCYIHIDVAHWIKTYANFLKNLPRRIKVFYMAAIGQLIMCRNIDDAASILIAILTIARSETEGFLKNGKETCCEIEKKKLKAIITGILNNENSEEILLEKLSPTDEDEVIEESDNDWSAWAITINNKIEGNLDEVGDRDNAHYFPQLADRLLRDINMFPLWSNVCRDNFGYGRVPASSAAVEGEFNKLKNNIFKNENLPIRVDEFLRIHLDYLYGKLKIVGAKNKDLLQSNKLTTTENECNSNKEVLNVDTSQVISQVITPSGAHVCIICKTAVHALPECSIAYDEEEGYGQKRICLSCSSSTNNETILASQEIEDWRGLISKENRKRTAKYLGNDLRGIQDSLTWSKSTKLPVIKNGSSIELQAVNIDNINYCLVNTCGFDSLLQIVLVALSDYKHFENKICVVPDNKIYEMAIDILDKGIRAHTYKLRAQILKPIFISENTIEDDKYNNCTQIDCQTNIGYLANILFSNTPSFEETSICSMGCPPRMKKLSVAQIDYNLMQQDNFYNIIQNNVILTGEKKCYQKDCPGFETTTLCKIGFIVLFDICILDINKTKSIKLDDIPSEIMNPIDKTNLYLIGIVNYKAPPMSRRGSNETFRKLGHYTAIVKRTGNCWMEYDDLSLAEKKVKKTKEVNPHLLMYINKNN